MPVILATQEAEIRKITVQSQPKQIVCETLSPKYPSQRWASGVDHVVGPEFKPQYGKKKKSILFNIIAEYTYFRISIYHIDRNRNFLSLISELC
jgi:hypothetical protein